MRNPLTLILALLLLLPLSIGECRANYRTDPLDGFKYASSMHFLGFDHFVTAVVLNGYFNPAIDFSELSLLLDIQSPQDFTNFTAELIGADKSPILTFHLPATAKIKQAGTAKAVTVEEVLVDEQLAQLKNSPSWTLNVTLQPSGTKQTIPIPSDIRQEWLDIFAWSRTGTPPAGTLNPTNK